MSKLVFAAMEAVTRTALGDEVSVFLTMDAVKGFTKQPSISEQAESSRLVKQDNRSYLDLFRMAKKSGKAKLYACSYASKLYDLSREKYIDDIDDIVGITSFLLEADGQITSIW
ncbi:MAG: DsrE family protein [Conexivisphaerales archaeon]